LEKAGERYSDHFYTVSVTYPDEGKDFQALMKRAFGKITDKDIYEKAESITQDTRKYAKKMYNKYSKWF
jgi:transketolase